MGYVYIIISTPTMLLRPLLLINVSVCPGVFEMVRCCQPSNWTLIHAQSNTKAKDINWKTLYLGQSTSSKQHMHLTKDWMLQ